MSGSQLRAPTPVYTRSNSRAEHVGNGVELRLHEANVDAGGSREIAGDGQRARGEVDAGDAAAEPRERDGVGADMALEVHDVEAGEITEPGPVVGDDRAQPSGIGRETGEVVVAGARMHGHPRLPVAEVRRPVLVEMLDEPRS